MKMMQIKRGIWDVDVLTRCYSQSSVVCLSLLQRLCQHISPETEQGPTRHPTWQVLTRTCAIGSTWKIASPWQHRHCSLAGCSCFNSDCTTSSQHHQLFPHLSQFSRLNKPSPSTTPHPRKPGTTAAHTESSVKLDNVRRRIRS